MKLKLLTFCLSFFFYYSNSQEWNWGIKLAGIPQIQQSIDLHVDAEGNIVLAGYFDGEVGVGPFSLTGTSFHNDMYLCRINSDKVVEWLIKIDSNSMSEETIAVTVDDDNFIYVTGNINGATFIAKYNISGDELWRTILTPEAGSGKSIALDQYDNIYISAGSGWNFFIGKLDPQGNVVWTKDIWYNYSDACNISDIKVDAVGNIYIAGAYGLDGFTVDNFTFSLESWASNNTFFGKLDTNGNVMWLKSSTGSTMVSPQIALNTDGHLYIANTSYGQISFEGTNVPGTCCSSTRPFIAKYTTSGDKIWTIAGHTTFNGDGIIKDLKTDYAGNLYIAGDYFTAIGVNQTGYNTYIERYNNLGTHQWRKEFIMPGTDFSHDLDIDNYGNCYYAGYNQSSTFIDEDQVGTYSAGVAEIYTGFPTYKETVRPYAQQNVILCGEGVLTATGNDLKWYSDPALTILVHSGNEYSGIFTDGQQMFVTQTINGVESWPRVITVSLPDVLDSTLVIDGELLVATENPEFTYQWYYQGAIVADATGNTITPAEGNNLEDYSVVISDQLCSVTLTADSLLADTFSFSGVKVYPNPIKENIYINGLETGTVIVTNTLGQIIFENTYQANTDIKSLNMQSQQPGLYFVYIAVKNQVQTFKVVKP